MKYEFSGLRRELILKSCHIEVFVIPYLASNMTVKVLFMSACRLPLCFIFDQKLRQ